mmetsp:Transcript_51738/g.150326  ORF Transcript_51738/g.150326 Transcript_51738/m.150326 type:complete len:227 (+) Transcript_51738:1564-2244(+)
MPRLPWAHRWHTCTCGAHTAPGPSDSPCPHRTDSRCCRRASCTSEPYLRAREFRGGTCMRYRRMSHPGSTAGRRRSPRTFRRRARGMRRRPRACRGCTCSGSVRTSCSRLRGSHGHKSCTPPPRAGGTGHRPPSEACRAWCRRICSVRTGACLGPRGRRRPCSWCRCRRGASYMLYQLRQPRRGTCRCSPSKPSRPSGIPDGTSRRSCRSRGMPTPWPPGHSRTCT